MVRRPGLVALLLLVTSMSWATAFVFIKLTDAAVGPFTLTACRGALAALVVSAVVVAITGQSPLPRPGEWRRWLMVSTVNGWLPTLLAVLSLREIPVGVGAMMNASSPLVVVLIASSFGIERLTGSRALGVVVGFAGLILLLGPAASAGGDLSPLGAAYMGGAVLVYSAGTILLRNLVETEPLRLALGQQAMSAVIMVPLALAIEGFAGFGAVPSTIWTVFGLGVLATAVPSMCFMFLLAQAGPTVASMNAYLMPLWATLLAVLVLGETLGMRELIAGATVLAGVWLVTRRPPVQAPG